MKFQIHTHTQDLRIKQATLVTTEVYHNLPIGNLLIKEVQQERPIFLNIIILPISREMQ